MDGQRDSRRTESVGDTLSNFWASRPVRPRRGGKIGGVAAAIGLRYGVDPVLIRVVFVVSAVYGGAGVLLYLLGWLLLPKEGDPMPGPNAARARPQPSSVVVLLLLVLLLIPVALWVLESRSALVVLALGLVAVFLLHRNYRDRAVSPAPASVGSGQSVESRADSGQAPEESTVDYPTDPQQHGFSAVAPQWHPAQPDQPHPQAQPYVPAQPYEPVHPIARRAPRKPRRHSITLVTTVLALASGIAATVLGAPLFAAFAIPLGVLGLGMVVGAFLRGGRGLIVLAVPVGAAAMFISVLPTGPNGYPAPFDAPWRGVQSFQTTPGTAQELKPQYRTSVGEIDLDLTRLPFDGPPVRTAASSQLGKVTIIVPPNVDVDATCSTRVGQMDCFDEQRTGRSGSHAQVHDTGADGPGGGQLQLDLSAGYGNVEVYRD